MANGDMELCALPLIYVVRSVAPRRKQAVKSIVCEESVHRVPSWTSSQAPTVAQVKITHDRPDNQPVIVDYRASRCADGKVRLVSDLESLAFLDENQSVHAPGFPPYVNADVFNTIRNLMRSLINECMVPSELNGRTIVSSERSSAIEYLSQITQSLVLIDGRLHAPVAEPGWGIEVNYNRYRAIPINSIKSCVDSGYGLFVAYSHKPTKAITELLPFLGVSNTNNIEPDENIRELVQGALGGDYMWRHLRNILGEHFNDSKLDFMDMTQGEINLYGMVSAAQKHWPQERKAGLAQACLRLSRVIHGIKPNGNADMLKNMISVVQSLQDTPAPLPLEQRLVLGGLLLPGLEDTANPDFVPGLGR